MKNTIRITALATGIVLASLTAGHAQDEEICPLPEQGRMSRCGVLTAMQDMPGTVCNVFGRTMRHVARAMSEAAPWRAVTKRAQQSSPSQKASR